MEVSVWVAVAAGAPGVIGLVLAALLWRRTSILRAGQLVLLPDGTSASLIDRQAGLQRTMDDLRQGVDDLEALVEAHARSTEEGLRTALRFHGMVRYDAYRDMGGRQSWSIALLDGDHSGSIISSLHARDHARVYLKEVVEGVPGQRLSPEEQQALTMAIERRPRHPRPAPDSAPPPSAAAGGGGEQSPPTAPASAPDDDGPTTGTFPAVRED